MRSGNARIGVRRLTADDVGAIDTLLRAAYGVDRPYRERIELYLRQRGAQPLVAEYDGRVAGVVCGNDYGTSAYVSLMGVDPALQRRGIGSALMTALIAWCDERGFRDVRLDATDAGAPLYERFGFVDFGATIVFERGDTTERERSAERLRAEEPPPRARIAAATERDVAAIARIDAVAFGADRSPMLEPLLAAHGALLASNERGYVVVQRSLPYARIGPWIAADAGIARELLEAALAKLKGRRLGLSVPATNEAAVDLVAAAGIAPTGRLRHMIRGAGKLPSRMVFGRVNLGQG